MSTTARNDAFALIARIEAFLSGAQSYHLVASNASSDTAKYLLSARDVIRNEMSELSRRSAELSAGAQGCLQKAVQLRWSNGDAYLINSIESCAMLSTFVGELRYHLRDSEDVWTSTVERAFLHLNRTLVVDESAADRWRAALRDGREEDCEKLGGVHLLSYGIWAFKAHGRNERTDLILGTGHRIISPTERQRRAVEALVLTEWKVVRDGEDCAAKVEEARIQAAAYSMGSLSGFELSSVRYLVTVGMSRQIEGDDVADGPVIYRHVHVAVEPSRPSAWSRSRRSR